LRPVGPALPLRGRASYHIENRSRERPAKRGHGWSALGAAYQRPRDEQDAYGRALTDDARAKSNDS